MTERARCDRSGFAQGLCSTLLISCLALGEAAYAQTAPNPPRAATPVGPAWSALTPAQRSALAPLRNDWPDIDVPGKQKWLEIAARFPSLPPDERQRIQQRMSEWTRMTPDERGRARLQFQEARQISPQQRQERWDAYLALPAEERRALAASARTVPKAVAADGSSGKPLQSGPKIVAPTVVQAKPGASTTLISKPASPPPHAQAGQPKITVGTDKVDRSTLLPQAGPKNATPAASAAQ